MLDTLQQNIGSHAACLRNRQQYHWRACVDSGGLAADVADNLDILAIRQLLFEIVCVQRMAIDRGKISRVFEEALNLRFRKAPGAAMPQMLVPFCPAFSKCRHAACFFISFNIRGIVIDI